MNYSKMKNMVVLKDLPSNIVDEAIIVLKSNVKIKERNIVESNDTKINEGMCCEDRSTYVLKEAEYIIKDYIEHIENSEKKETNKKLNLSYRNWKICSLIMGIIAATSILINMI